MNPDFRDLLRALSDAGVRFLVVGAYAVSPLGELAESDLSTPDIVFQIGVAPRRIDIMTSITGVDFESAWPARAVDLDLLRRHHRR